jgi:hypothetical protein
MLYDSPMLRLGTTRERVQLPLAKILKKVLKSHAIIDSSSVLYELKLISNFQLGKRTSNTNFFVFIQYETPLLSTSGGIAQARTETVSRAIKFPRHQRNERKCAFYQLDNS